MNVRRALVGLASAAVVLVGSSLVTTAPAQAVPGTAPALVMPSAVKYQFKNCTALHRVYPHGVGKSGAKDKVRGKTKPITTFKRSTSLYNKMVRFHGDLDRDKDGIACEKK